MQTEKSDYLVIGTGLAGLAFALKVAHRGTVTLLSKEKANSANTPWAQGGIAAVVSKEDSFESHIYDTLRAGAGLCRREVVQNYVEQAPERIADLQKWGVKFNRSRDKNGEMTLDPDLTIEGGHSMRRVLHFDDSTGSEIHRALLHQVRNHPNIRVLENHFAIDLLTSRHLDSRHTGQNECFGAYVLDQDSGQVRTFVSPHTILSTGGAGKVYLYTSNWSGASGDGIAMAWRAGARVANLEFMQFHPTCLFHPESRNFLISEALRGEGGKLVTASGEEFMNRYDDRGALAPRDIVARSIDAEMKRTGAPCVYLDMRHLGETFLREHFPMIFQKCFDLGIDISKQPIPVVPAAHYLCGGVLTDVSGRTDIANLYALGETSCTGLHGANRLASNSLLECLTMAHNASVKVESEGGATLPSQVPDWVYPPHAEEDELIVITHMWEEIRRLMWNYVGIVRSNKRLMRASHRLKNVLAEVREYYSNSRVHKDILELRNIAIVADLSVECALRREESRGIHYNLDWPWAPKDVEGFATEGKDTILEPGRI